MEGGGGDNKNKTDFALIPCVEKKLHGARKSLNKCDTFYGAADLHTHTHRYSYMYSVSLYDIWIELQKVFMPSSISLIFGGDDDDADEHMRYKTAQRNEHMQ